MNFTVSESIEFSNNILKPISNFKNKNFEIIICPSYMSLPFNYQILSNLVKFGAQNISHNHGEKGSFTGEISANMVSDYAEYVILGHSERRINLYESNKNIDDKRKLSLENDLKPIICIGENSDLRNKNKYLEFLTEQLNESISTKTTQSIVAYEPIWSIGTGTNCSLDKVLEISSLVKSIIGDNTIFIYGGSVNKDNVLEYLSSPDINGVLVGSASLDKNSVEEMLNIIDAN